MFCKVSYFNDPWKLLKVSECFNLLFHCCRAQAMRYYFWIAAIIKNGLCEGYRKVVTKSILYNRSNPKIVAHCLSTTAMEEEIEALRHLQKLPGVVKVRDFTEHTDKKGTSSYGLICKYYQGGDLSSELKKHKGRLSLKQRIWVAIDILQGLE